MHQKRVRKWWRCAECGRQFASSAPGCQEHPKALMHEWTRQLAAAYRTQVMAIERGEEPVSMMGLMGNTFELAAKLARRWAKKTQEALE